MDKTINFDTLVSQIEQTNEALQDNARLVINRHVTAKAWLTGYYIVEYELKGEDRARYGEQLLQKLAERLNKKNFSYRSLKLYKQFYLIYKPLNTQVYSFLMSLSQIRQTPSAQFLLPESKELTIGQSVSAQLPIIHNLAYYRKNIMMPDDNPPVGILMCSEVGQEMAEYTLLDTDEDIFISKYELNIPSKERMTEFLRKENEGM